MENNSEKRPRGRPVIYKDKHDIEKAILEENKNTLESMNEDEKNHLLSKLIVKKPKRVMTELQKKHWDKVKKIQDENRAVKREVKMTMAQKKAQIRQEYKEKLAHIQKYACDENELRQKELELQKKQEYYDSLEEMKKSMIEEVKKEVGLIESRPPPPKPRKKKAIKIVLNDDTTTGCDDSTDDDDGGLLKVKKTSKKKTKHDAHELELDEQVYESTPQYNYLYC